MPGAPERMCVGCRVHKDKKLLLRIVRNPERIAQWDNSGKISGRGAYLCRDAECLRKAQKSRALERALKISIGDEIYQRLSEELNG